MLQSIVITEKKLGRPGSSVEIFVTLNHEYFVAIKNMWECAAVLCSIFREDWIFTNTIGSHWTRERKDGYKSYSELFREKFPGYKLDSYQRVMNDSAKATNFKSLISMLKSKN